MKYVVAGPVLVPVPFNLPSTAYLLTSSTTNSAPVNPSTSFPADPSTPVDPAHVPTTTTTTVAPVVLLKTTTVPANCPATVAPAPDPTITNAVPANPPTPVVPEPDKTTTTCVYTNSHTQNSPVHYPIPPPTHVVPVPDTLSPTNIDYTVVSDCNVVKWYDYKDVIDLYEFPSLQWRFTNKFDDPVYPNSVVWMSRLYDWLMMYG